MAMENEALILDLVEWIAAEPRPYDDVMEAWRASCPRLPIGEDAVALKFVLRKHDGTAGPMARVTDTGRALLAARGRGGAVPQSRHL